MVDIIETIIKYGATPVLIALVVFLIIWFAKCLKRLNEKQQESIEQQQKSIEKQQSLIESQEGRVSEIFKLVQTICKDTQHTHPGKEEEENRRCNALVMELLGCLRKKTEANRVSCFIYHNGGYDVTGRSFQKMSMLYEVVDEKTVSVMGSYQNVPRTLLFTLTQKLSEQGYYDIPNIEDIKSTDAITYQVFYARGAKAAYCGVIKDSHKNILGFVVVEYAIDECKDENKVKDLIKAKIDKISAALEVKPDAPLNQGGKK